MQQRTHVGRPLGPVLPCLIACVTIVIGACSSPETSAQVHTRIWMDDTLESTAIAAGHKGPEDAHLPPLDDSASLDEYLAYAALNNPDLEAAFYRWKAALERVPQVRSLPDPRFTYRYFIKEVETRVGPQQQAVALQQTFPWFGKLGLRADMATQDAHAAKRLYDAAKLNLFYRVKNAYYDYYYLGRAIAVVRENRDLVKYLEEVVRTKYKTAASGHPEVIRAQVELGKLEDQLQTLLDLQGPTVARLNAALNRPIDEPLPWPTVLPEEQILATNEEILAWLREGNPELQAMDHEIAKEQHSVDLAKRDYFPDMTLGLEYTDVGSARRMPGAGLRNPATLRGLSRLGGGMGDIIDVYAVGNGFVPQPRSSDSGQDVWAITLSLNVPIWQGKYAAGQREARARHIATMRARTERQNNLEARVRQVLYDFRDAERKIDLYRDTLVAKARQSLKATEASFRAGSAGFLDVVDAQRVLLDFQLSYERALTRLAQRLAELEMLVGRPIPRGSEERGSLDTDARPDAAEVTP